MTFPLKFGGRNCTLWMSRLSKSRFLKTLLAPFEPPNPHQGIYNTQGLLITNVGAGWFNGIGDL
jgi:hypothetical protein